MDKLAIIGVGCLFPGGDNPETFYQSLLEQKDCLSQHEPFDIGFDRFTVPVDIAHLKSLGEHFVNFAYIVHEALRSSGYLQNKAALKKAGIIMGNRESFTESEFNLFGSAYYSEIEKNIRILLKDERFTFGEPFDLECRQDFLATGIFNFSYPVIYAAQTFSLQGPAFAFDAACASSLYSIEMAGAYLNAGIVDMMVAGGAFFGLGNEALPKFFDSLGVTAKPGESRPLDKNSGGMIANEGGGAIVLKRLADAERDGNHIFAVIDSVGWSNSGRGKQVLAPSHQGQIYAYEDAFAHAATTGVTPLNVDYIECHATGTSVGDLVELNSLETFYKTSLAADVAHSKPLFGALKGNIGHLLTGASIASLIKVIYSMKHNEIPATYNISEPMSSEEGFFCGDNMVTKNMPWPNAAQDKQNKKEAALKAKCAAINGFGFGGSNAHMIVSEYVPITQKKEQRVGKLQQMELASLSVIGLSAHMADLASAKEVSDALYYGRTPNKKKTTKRLKGFDSNAVIDQHVIPVAALHDHYYFSPFEFDFLKNSVHPSEESEAVNKELLLLKLADEALEDAGFVKGEAQNVAVIIAAKQSLFQLPLGFQVYMDELIPKACQASGIELTAEAMKKIVKLTREALLSPRVGFDLIASCIGPIVANRISLVWNLIGPSLKLCCLENSLAQSLQLAQTLMSSRDLDAVLVGIIDSDPVLESGIWHHKYGEQFGLSMHHLVHGEGAVAFVLKKSSVAKQCGDYVYADIKNISMLRADESSDREALLNQLVTQSLKAAHIEVGDVGYVEIAGDPCAKNIQQSLRILDRILVNAPCSAGSAALNLGQSFMMSSGASLLKTLLMFNGSFKPKTLKAANKQLGDWAFDNLQLPAVSNYWMNINEICYASVISAGFNQSYSHILLSKQSQSAADQAQQTAVVQNKSFYKKNDAILVVKASSIADLQLELSYVLSCIEPHTLVAVLKQTLLLRYRNAKDELKHLTAVFVGDSLQTLIKDIEEMQRLLKSAAENSIINWQSKSGSCFVSKPLAKEAKVCVCYPPSGLSTPSVVYELISSVPEINLFLQKRIAQAHPEIKSVLADIDGHQKSKQELPIFMDGLVGGLCSELLYRVIGVDPDAFVGLSFGELVMNSVTQVYTEEQGADFIVDLVAPYIKRLSDPVFIRNYFADYEFKWSTYFCTGDREKLAKLLSWVEAQEQVFLTINASPTTIIISGRRELCESGAKKYGCLAYPISENIFVHTPLAMHFYDEIIETNLKHPYLINEKKRASYYKTYDKKIFNFEKEDFAKNVADCICRPIDFKGVLEAAYTDGARLFIGMDGGDLCASWIEENLGDADFAVLSLKSRGMSFIQSIYALTAKLLTHGVDLDIGKIYGFSEQQLAEMERTLEPVYEKNTKSLLRIISNEPNTFSDVMLKQEHVDFFDQQIYEQTNPEQFVRTHADQKNIKAPANQTQPLLEPVAQSDALSVSQTLFGALPLRAGEMQLFELKQSLLKDIFANNILMQQHYLQTQNNCVQLLLKQVANGEAINVASPLQVAVPVPAVSEEQKRPKKNYAKTDPKKEVIWDQKLIENVTLGKVSDYWGAHYKSVDDYEIRVRLPAPPFMFISRVISLRAKFGELKPSMIEMEYDIPKDAWYLCRGYVPASVATESSHCGILLLAYMGVDVLFEGRLRFRAVDSTFTAFADKLLCAGETCRGVFEITSIMQHKGGVLIFYTYNLYDANNLRLFQIKGMGGLFSEEELELVKQNKDVAKTLAKDMQKNIEKHSFDYPLKPEKNIFDEQDLENVQKGRNDLCFGAHYPASYEYEQMYPPKFRVLNRISTFDLAGGDYGLGMVVGEADIDPTHWVFDAHFPNDPVLPATFTIEGAVQLIVFFFHASGLAQNKQGTYLEPRLVLDQVSTFKFRDAIKRVPTKVRYEAIIKFAQIEPQVVITGDVRIYNEDKLIAFVDNIAFKLTAPDVAQSVVQQAVN